MQPFINLMQSNMGLLAKYAMSPEAMTQAMTQLQAAMKQTPGSTSPLAQSGALAELTQGMMENYTRFMSEVTQNSMALFAQGQGAFLQQAQDAADAAGEGGRSRRTRS
jgi:hypothetical protein